VIADEKTLRIVRTFQAPAEAVFEAWTSEEVLRRWFHAGRDWGTSDARVDLRVGGALRVVMSDPDDDEHGGGGHYTEIDPPSRLAFTWTWDRDPTRQMLVEIDFEEAEGATTVRFSHSGLEDEDSVRNHEDGWTKCFDNLERALESAPRGR
jgi:glutathione S-transferase